MTPAEQREVAREILVFGPGVLGIMDQLIEATAHVGHKVGTYKFLI